MDTPDLVRNVALCGHLHHGKVSPASQGGLLAVLLHLRFARPRLTTTTPWPDYIC